ncbi:MAG: hypothetical protein ACPMAQ_05580 [Phycisphaerae bacterium]
MAEKEIPIWDPDAIDWEDVRRSRQTPGMQRAIASLRLQEMARKMTMQAIRRQHPGADEAEVMRIYREWLARFAGLDALW